MSLILQATPSVLNIFTRKQFFTFSVERQMNTSHFLRHLGQIVMFVESLVG